MYYNIQVNLTFKYFRDDRVRPKILRIFKIWEQRSVYDEEFLSDLTGLLSAGAIKKTDDDPLDFQVNNIYYLFWFSLALGLLIDM